MPSQYVSICGHSGTGKKTLIKRLLADDSATLRERFGIAGTVAAYGYCFEPLPGIFSSTADTVLYQWQFEPKGFVEQLQQHAPKARHRILLMCRPLEDQQRTLFDRGEWKPSITTLKWCWRDQIGGLFRDAPSRGFELVLVDTSDEEYRIVPQWPDYP